MHTYIYIYSWLLFTELIVLEHWSTIGLSVQLNIIYLRCSPMIESYRLAQGIMYCNRILLLVSSGIFIILFTAIINI